MQVAEAFGKLSTVLNLDGLSIDARALYLLSAPGVHGDHDDRREKYSAGPMRLRVHSLRVMLQEAFVDAQPDYAVSSI
jgi:hypothetical protein